MKKAIFGLSIVMSSFSFAETIEVTGKISKIRMFSSNHEVYSASGKGTAYLYRNQLPGACGSLERRVAISTDHPLFESVVSVALVSKTSGQEVSLRYVDTCTQRGNAWDFALIDLI